MQCSAPVKPLSWNPNWRKDRYQQLRPSWDHTKCMRFARVTIDGKPYCKLHAGMVALERKQGMIGDLPTMAAASYASSSYDPHTLWGDNVVHPSTANGRPVLETLRRIQAYNAHPGNNQLPQQQGAPEVVVRRIVQVFVADPNENVPLDNCLLFKGDVKLTDATDQELFFELDIKGLLEAHNVKRITFVDKKIKDRTEYLEPAKVRDLKMTVVTVASL